MTRERFKELLHEVINHAQRWFVHWVSEPHYHVGPKLSNTFSAPVSVQRCAVLKGCLQLLQQTYSIYSTIILYYNRNTQPHSKGRSRRCNFVPWNIALKALLLLIAHSGLSRRGDSCSDCIIAPRAGSVHQAVGLFILFWCFTLINIMFEYSWI